MKTKLFSKIFLFLAITFFFLSFIFSWNKSQRTNLNITQFEKVLYSKETQTQDFLKLLKEEIKLHNFNLINDVIFFKDIDFTPWNQKEIYFAIYQYDSLRLWTDNHLILPEILDDRLDLNIGKIGNSWYEIKRIRFGNYELIGLIKIKDEFPFENKYLQDRFAKDFGFIPGDVKISLIPVSYGFDVKSQKGQYLFSLVPASFDVRTKEHHARQILFFVLAVWFLVIYFALTLPKFSFRDGGILLLILIIIRALMMIFHKPIFLYATNLFSPVLVFYSIGDLLIDVPIFLLFLYLLSVKFNYSEFRPEQNYVVYDFVIVSLLHILVISLLYFAYDLLYAIILHTELNFKLYNIFNLSFESLLIILYFGIIFLSIFVFYYNATKWLMRYSSQRLFIFLLIIIALFILGINNLIVSYKGFFYKLVLLLPLFILIFASRKRIEIFHLLIFIGFLTAFIVVTVILVGLDSKLNKKLETNSQNIDFFRDNITEQLLMHISEKIANDEMLNSYLSHPWTEELKQKLQNYLSLEYLDGYLKKYGVNILVCGKGDDFNGGLDYQVCMNKYSTILERNGIKIARYAYFVNQMGRLPEYFIYYPGEDKILIVELFPTTIEDRVGYPDLLLKQNQQANRATDFQYAVYKNGKLVYKKGDFIYPRSDSIWQSWKRNTNFFKWNGYKHYVNFDEKNEYLIVVSYKAISFIDFIISLAYLFVFFVLLLSVFYAVYYIALGKPSFTFRTRIILIMIGTLTIAFVISGILTAVISVMNYKEKFYNQIKQTLARSRYTIEQVNLTNGEKRDNNYKLRYSVKNLASILNVDINLYDASGYLLASSREAIFDNNLLGNRMNYKALDKLVNQKFVEYLDKEAIGKLSYNSAYTIITDFDKQLAGFINIPYFANPQELRKEILDLLITLANVYIIMFLVVVSLAYMLSAQIISPLKELQEKLKQLKVGHRYEKIGYKRKDEIGSLVEEYNNMVDKLEESVRLLAKSERENAWRDMAKQVAHEIKNPLTPMKLSIQLLQKAWENKDDNFGERLNEVTHTLIEQIENLRNIAEEFSNFAKMPKSENEKIDLAQKIDNIVRLYENIENVEVKAIIKNRPIYIWADNKQISRALINLIKNAIQAIPEGVKGIVIVELERNNDKALIKVIDNGSGIPEEVREKLFTPSFTTKSSGMGLGLSMVKNIVQNAHGRIWFDTEIGKGTTFYIEFPIYQTESS